MKEETKSKILEQAAKTAFENADGKPVQIMLREGKANDVKEPQPIDITGNIDAPALFVENRHQTFDAESAHVEVDRENMKITLITEETSPYANRITGVMVFSEGFKKLKINNGEYISNFDMAELIKMNRSYFQSRDEAMKLVSELRNFKAKVERDLELSDDKRGNINIKKSQAVDSNLPKAFTLRIPIFKGQPENIFKAEVEVNPNDLSMTLVSPEANDLISDNRDNIINSQLSRIKDADASILIIEQ